MIPDCPELFQREGETGLCLLASCLGQSTGGGLIHFDGKHIEIIDRLSTTGMVACGKGLARLLWANSDYLAPAEMLRYDELGIRQYVRLDTVRCPHDILWDGEAFAIASTGTNSVVWVGADGGVRRSEVFPGEPDSWHVNGLLQDGDRLLVSVFGRFSRMREWFEHMDDRSGKVFDLATGETLVGLLDQPHHPRLLDVETLLVCNSGKREIVLVERKTGEIKRRVGMERWTRGVAISDQYVFVGESARRNRPRGDEGDALSRIAIIERRTWSVVARIPLPFEEIYDLVLVPATLLPGLRRGFRTNPQRVAEQNQHMMFSSAGIQPAQIWIAGDLIVPGQGTITVRTELDGPLRAGTIEEHTCVIENGSKSILVSAPPYPVRIAYRWVSVSGQVPENDSGFHTLLPHPIPPGTNSVCRFRFRAPEQPGQYWLGISLSQREDAFLDIEKGVTPYWTKTPVDVCQTGDEPLNESLKRNEAGEVVENCLLGAEMRSRLAADILRNSAPDVSVLAVLLFGSQANGNAHANSDFDLLVIADKYMHSRVIETEGRTLDVIYGTVSEFERRLSIRNTDNNDFAVNVFSNAVILLDTGGEAQRLREAARELWRQGPPEMPMREGQRWARRIRKMLSVAENRVMRAMASQAGNHGHTPQAHTVWAEEHLLAAMRLDEVASRCVYLKFSANREWTTAFPVMVRERLQRHPELNALWTRYVVAGDDLEAKLEVVRQMVAITAQALRNPAKAKPR